MDTLENVAALNNYHYFILMKSMRGFIELDIFLCFRYFFPQLYENQINSDDDWPLEKM